MKILTLICLTLVEWIKQLGRLPAAAAKALQHRQRQAGLNALEAERLDRIRHPEKYRGK
jgi:hypothetical protein